MISAAGNARIVANAADPFDTPEQIVIRERINCVNSLAHWQIITESESIKEPRGRSRSQSYSQIALLHSHLFLHDQLTFADISGTDNRHGRQHAWHITAAFKVNEAFQGRMRESGVKDHVPTKIVTLKVQLGDGEHVNPGMHLFQEGEKSGQG